jgi:hypothetical protein
MPFDKEISFYKRCQNYDGVTPQADYFQDVAIPYPLRYLLPGHVFTFQYLDNVDESMIISIPEYIQPKKNKQAIMAAGLLEPSYLIERPYFDLRPIGLSLPNLGVDNQSEYVLNLKMMPTLDRIQVLELIYRVVVPLILRAGIVDHGEHEGDLIPFRDRLQNGRYTQPFLGFKMENLTGQLGRGLYFWVNKYDKNRMRDVKVIDFDQLPRFGQADYSDDAYTRFNGATLPDVQALYTSYVKNT